MQRYAFLISFLSKSYIFYREFGENFNQRKINKLLKEQSTRESVIGSITEGLLEIIGSCRIKIKKSVNEEKKKA